MATTKLRHGSNFVITFVSLVVIVVVINVLSYRKLFFARLDLTEGKDYTISSVTREKLAGLENLVNVTVYLSEDLPAVLLTFERQLKDLLAAYETYGRGNLRIEYVSPKNDRETQMELMYQGIQPQPVAEYKSDSSTQKLVYNTIVIEYEDKKEVIQSLLEQVGGRRQSLGLISDFEYLMTSNILKVQREGRQVVGWYTNAPDVDLDKDYRSLREAVTKEWEVRDIRAQAPTRIAADIAVLVAISPRDLSDAYLYEIDQFVMRGGKLLALVDGFKRQTRGNAIEAFVAEPTNFTDLLEKYGLKTNSEIAMDRPPYCALAPWGRMLSAYPFWIKIMSTGFNKEIPAVSRLRMLTLPWTMTFDASSSAPSGVQVVSLAHTSRASTVRPGPRVSPDPQAGAAGAQASTRTVVAAVMGAIPSYFPKGTPIPLDANTTAPSPSQTSEAERKYESVGGQIVVVGTSHFVHNDFFQLLGGFQRANIENNGAFFLNTIEWLALGQEGLGGIRARQAVARPIKSVVPEVKDPKNQISETQRKSYKIFGTFTMPVLVVGIGFLYNTIRRRRRRSAAERLLGG